MIFNIQNCLIIGLVNGCACGLLYIIICDLYNIYIKNDIKYIKHNRSINIIINPGLVIGFCLGSLRVYTGSPLLIYFYTHLLPFW